MRSAANASPAQLNVHRANDRCRLAVSISNAQIGKKQFFWFPLVGQKVIIVITKIQRQDRFRSRTGYPAGYFYCLPKFEDCKAPYALFALNSAALDSYIALLLSKFFDW